MWAGGQVCQCEKRTEHSFIARCPTLCHVNEMVYSCTDSCQVNWIYPIIHNSVPGVVFRHMVHH